MSILIEKEHVIRDYGFSGINAIIDHPKYGRLLLRDGYGGEGSIQGGAVRWRHGIALKLKAEDTLDSLKNTHWNDETSLFFAVINGYDDQRPVQDWDGIIIKNIAKSVGL
ncbi:hypothetical protein QUO15_004414 [Vibrio parahaemolyticus]|nr:hypothetical protein [Vibrio parahaemolyticus]